MDKKYNLSTIYNTIYTTIFKNRPFLNIDSGWVLNNKYVYLDLSDLNMIDDLGNILDFYRKIIKEGTTYRIKLQEKTSLCKHTDRNSMCITCNRYICDDCKKDHIKHKIQENVYYSEIYTYCNLCNYYTDEPMIYHKNNKICKNCINEDELGEIIIYSKSIINRFNLYEWVPIGIYLENRNVNSHLYTRKMEIIYHNNFIELKLLDKKAEYITDFPLKTMINILDKYKVPSTIEDKLLYYSGIYNATYEKNREIVILDSIIISE